MADEPLSTTVTETTSVDTGVDKATVESLNQQFEDFWAGEDAKEEGAPAAPGEGAGQETKETKPDKTDKTDKEPEPEKPKEYTDEEIDKLEFNRPDSKPFHEIRELWKADRAAMKAEKERVAQLAKELEEARQNSWTPESKADYEHAVGVRRRFDVANDPEFIRKYHEPISNQYESILTETVQALPDTGAAQEWAQYMREHYTPDQLSREWWQQKVLAKIPDEIDRQSILAGVAQMQKQMKERDSELNRRAGDKSAFDEFRSEQSRLADQRMQAEIKAEIAEREKEIKDYLPRDEEAAKTKEERESIREHNERFSKLNQHFLSTMQDLGQNGYRAWVRASIQATRAQVLEENYKNLEKEHKTVLAERDKFRAELDKIHGVRRKLSNTSGTPPASQKKEGGLTLKDLDVRKAFEKYDWGDT